MDRVSEDGDQSSVCLGADEARQIRPRFGGEYCLGYEGVVVRGAWGLRLGHDVVRPHRICCVGRW
jgi:hypothetical protein